MSKENEKKLEELKKELDINTEELLEGIPTEEPDEEEALTVPAKLSLWGRAKEFYGKNKKPIKKWSKRLLIGGGILVGGLLGLDYLAKHGETDEDPEDSEDYEDDPDALEFDGEDLEVSDAESVEAE